MRIVLRSCSLVFVLLVAGHSAALQHAPGGAPPVSRALIAQPEVTIAAGAENVVPVHVLSNALCTLSSGDDESGLEIVSDPEGNAQVTVTIPEPNVLVQPVLSCSTLAGSTASYLLNIRSAQGIRELRAPQPHGRMRPPLADPERVRTDDELRTGGYPRRPDRATQPDAYNQWLSHVSSPAMVIDNKDFGLAPARHRRATVNNNSNWAGYVASAGTTPFYEVLGQWTQPRATYPTTYLPYVSQRFDADLWVGLGDASSGGTMWQAGSDVTSYTVIRWPSIFATYTSYALWAELIGNCGEIPFYPSPNAGDSLSTWLWFSGSSSCQGIAVTGNNDTQYLGMQITNYTQNLVYNWCQSVTGLLNTMSCSASPVTGKTAEWILERALYRWDGYGPSQCTGQNYLPNLLNVNGVTISSAQAYSTQWYAAASLNPTMQEMDNTNIYGFCDSNTGRKLADAAVQTSNVVMNWYNYN